MKAKSLLQLEFPGFAIFDPVHLQAFIDKYQIKDNNILDFFVNNPTLGDLAIKEGIVIPIYSILEEDYTIIVDNEYTKKDTDLFSYGPFPLKVISNKIIISDIYALTSWESDFYPKIDINYKSMPSMFIVEQENANYDVNIIGFYENQLCYGYKIILNKTETLTSISNTNNIDSYNFEIVQRTKKEGKLQIEPVLK